MTFVCIEDPYKRGFRKYTWDTVCREAPDLCQLYAPQWVVYNAAGYKGDVSENIHDLLEYLKDPDEFDLAATKNKLIRELHEAAKRIMMDGRLRQVISQMAVREQSLEVNTELRVKKEMVINMIAINLPLETIADITNLSIEKVREWAQK